MICFHQSFIQSWRGGVVREREQKRKRERGDLLNCLLKHSSGLRDWRSYYIPSNPFILFSLAPNFLVFFKPFIFNNFSGVKLSNVSV